MRPARSEDHAVGVLFDYFAAPSDERAGETIDVNGGPGQAGLPVVPVKGIDPVVQLGKLESLLTGADYEAVVASPRCGHPVAIRDEGELLVLTITDELQDALADASPEQLDAVAVPWSQIEEFPGDVRSAGLASFLAELAQLARGALENGDRLYCWTCL
jgi:hypothetical protein